MRLIRSLLFIGATCVLSACGGSESKGSNITSQNTPTNTGDKGSIITPPSTAISSEAESSQATSSSANNSNGDTNQASFLLGENLYIEHCSQCHLADGSAPKGAELIACTDCSDLSALSYRIDETMPPTDTDLLNAEQSKNIAVYIQQQFNNHLLNPEDSTEGTDERPQLKGLSAKEAAYKLAFDVAATLPNASDIAEFENASDHVIDRWLNSDNFYQKLMSFYNKKLKSDRFHSRFERESNYKNARDLLGSCERGMGNTCNNNASDRMLYFPNYRWWDDLPFEGVITDLTNDAIAREPLEFIRYVAKNDLPFSEILTANYALVNAYSAKSLSALNLDGTAISTSDFEPISAPQTTQMIDGLEVTGRHLTPFKQQLKTLNRLRGSDVQLNIGNDTKLEEFIGLYPEDPTDFIPARIVQGNVEIPLAGILTTKAFLNGFTTTPTNKQRTRANMAFNIFAATDILAIEANRDASLIDFSDSIGAEDPTKTNEDCLICHRKLDPVADAFKNWLYNGVYANSACQDSANINGCATSPSVGIGFEGLSAPIFGNNSVDSKSLPWLAQQIATSPLFTQSVVHTLFEGFTGKPVLALNPQADEHYQLQYQRQQALLAKMSHAFTSSNENIKTTTKVLITSDYYLAREAQSAHTVVGSDRILGADQLQQKFYATTRHISSTTEVDDSFRLNLGNRATWKMYGGVDGLNTHTLPNEQGGIMLTIQERLANEMACFVTAQDLYRTIDKRLFMAHVPYQMPQGNTTAAPYIINELDIKKTIQHMHLHFWHEEVSLNSQAVNKVYTLFNDVLTLGQALRESGDANRNVDSYCRVDYEPDTNELLPSAMRGYRDDEYAVRAWAVIVAYFLGDFKFSHI